MKRLLGLLAAFICTSSVIAPGVEAQCFERCTTVVNEALEVIGYGCVSDSDFRTTCTATAFRCTSDSCGGVGLIMDIQGTALASAQVCGSEMGDLTHLHGVPARPAAAALTPHVALADSTQLLSWEAPANEAHHEIDLTRRAVAAAFPGR